MDNNITWFTMDYGANPVLDLQEWKDYLQHNLKWRDRNLSVYGTNDISNTKWLWWFRRNSLNTTGLTQIYNVSIIKE